MKICWDNLEKLEYNKKTGKWYTRTSAGILSYTYIYKEFCKYCRDPFLSCKNREIYCCKSCAKLDKPVIIKDKEKWKKNISISISGYKNPMKRKKVSAKISKLRKRQWLDKESKYNQKEYREKLSIAAQQNIGEKNPNWKGGISNDPYCDGWTQLSKELREESGKCQNPFCEQQNGRLTTHHIDYNKENCHSDNLIVLCNSCNIRANQNREWWQTFYIEIKKRLKLNE